MPDRALVPWPRLPAPRPDSCGPLQGTPPLGIGGGGAWWMAALSWLALPVAGPCDDGAPLLLLLTGCYARRPTRFRPTSGAHAFIFGTFAFGEHQTGTNNPYLLFLVCEIGHPNPAYLYPALI